MSFQRIPEPDLMDDVVQAAAYAGADFEQPHTQFIELFRKYFDQHDVRGTVLDLGCGPCDISWRFAVAYPDVCIDAIDGAAVMLAHGRKLIAQRGLQSRVLLYQCYLPDDTLPGCGYDTVISNSLLHHLLEARVLWQTINEVAAPGAVIFIMDLLRPDSKEQAQKLVETYAEGEAEILRQDFYHSLLAAYTVAEVEAQLETAGLEGLSVQVVSDRHLLVSGFLQKCQR